MSNNKSKQFFFENKFSLENSPAEYGKSITDACLGWDETITLLNGLAEAVRQRKPVIINDCSEAYSLVSKFHDCSLDIYGRSTCRFLHDEPEL